MTVKKVTASAKTSRNEFGEKMYYGNLSVLQLRRTTTRIPFDWPRSVLVLTHANFTHLGISSEQETHPDDSTHFIKKNYNTREQNYSKFSIILVL